MEYTEKPTAKRKLLIQIKKNKNRRAEKRILEEQVTLPCDQSFNPANLLKPNPAEEAEEPRRSNWMVLFSAVAVTAPAEACETVREEAMAKESEKNQVQYTTP